MPSSSSPYLAGMGKVSTQSLVDRANHIGMARLNGDAGSDHDMKMEEFPKGGRRHEFHKAARNAHWNAADENYDAAKGTVANIAEPIIAINRKPTGNYTGRYN